MKQTYLSKDTSVNTVSRVYTKRGNEMEGAILDYGGGRYDTNADYMKRTYDKVLLVYDPYNRDKVHNGNIRAFFRLYPPMTIVCSNVLNVIKENNVIRDILLDMKSFMCDNTIVYITVYERDKTGIGCETSKGWQRNEKLQVYLRFVETIFPKSEKFNISIKNSIMCIKKECV